MTPRLATLLLLTAVACGGDAGPPAGMEAPAAGPPAGVVTLDPAAREAAGLVVAPAVEVRRTAGLGTPAVVAMDETRTSRIGAVVDGIVVATYAEVGDRVPAGFVLAAVHSAIVHEAWADYRKAVAERRQAGRELRFAEQAEARARRLLRDQAGSVQEAERAAVDRAAAEEHLEMAQTDVRRAEETLEHLGITSGDDPSGESGEVIPARTPLSGVVLERLVSGGTAVTTGTPLFVVSDLSSLWVLAEVDDTAVGRVTVGQPVSVAVAAYPGATFAGAVAFVGDVVNPKTRRVTVRCAVPNPDGRLKPAMYARVTLEAGAPRPVVEVPAEAVHDLDGRTVVFVEEGDGRYASRDVRTGPEAQGRVEVLDGLHAGERVVVKGSVLLESELLGHRLGREED